MSYRVSASFGNKRIVSKKSFTTKIKALKLAAYINKRKSSARARVIKG